MEDHLAWTMLHAFLPFSSVYGPVSPVHLSVASALVIVVVAFVGVPALPGEDTVPMLLVQLVPTLVLIAVWLPTLAPLAFAMADSANKVAYIERPVLPLVLAESFRLPAAIRALIGVPVCEEVRAMACFETVLKFALILVSVFPDVHSIALSFATLPLADVTVSVDAAPHSMAFLLSSVPLAIKDFSVAPGIDPLSMRFAYLELPNVYIAVLVSLIALALALIVLPLPLIDPFLHTVDHHTEAVSLAVDYLPSVERLQVLLEAEIRLHSDLLPVIELFRFHLVFVGRQCVVIENKCLRFQLFFIPSLGQSPRLKAN